MKKFITTLAVVVIGLAFLAAPAFAQMPGTKADELAGRFGVGFNSQALSLGTSEARPYTTNMASEGSFPSLSVKYSIMPVLGIEGLFGYSRGSLKRENQSDQTSSVLALGTKVYYNVIQKQNATFYAGGGLLRVSGKDEIPVPGGIEITKGSEISMLGYGGTEFFFSGLPNLGFSMEFGIKFLVYGEWETTYPAGDPDKVEVGGFGTYGGVFNQIGVHYYF